VENKKDFREAKNTLGVILVHQKRYKEAIEVLLPLANDILYATPETAWGNLGWAYLLSGNTTKAIEALERALALQPEFCVGAYRLGLAYERKGEFKAARDAFSRAVETDRRECNGLLDAYKARARVALKLGDPEAAREDLKRCRELAGETPEGQECSIKLKRLK
jgi:tetratricopeptide (TPR) repeat protein